MARTFKSTTRKAFAGKRKRRGKFKRRRPFRSAPKKGVRRIASTPGPGYQIALGPRVKRVKFTLTENMTINAINGQGNVTTRLSSNMVDPLETHGSKKPRGFDQWMAFYDVWRVRYCTFTLRIKNVAAGQTGSNAIVFGIKKEKVLADTIATADRWDTWSLYPLTQFKNIGVVSNPNDGHSIKFMTVSLNPLMMQHQQGQSTDWNGTITGAPTRNAYANLIVSPQLDNDWVGTAPICRIQVKMTFWAELTDRKDMTLS